MNSTIRLTPVALMLAVTACARPAGVATNLVASDELFPTGTFSIIAYDSATGQLGGAVQSRVFSVGNGVRWTKYGRQFAVMDAKGNVAAYTGPRASAWAGDRQATHVSAQGNILAGPGVVDSMLAAYSRTQGSLALRLVAALEAGQAAGGDTRGKQSAALLIVKKCGGVWLHNDVVLRLQVDDHPEPIAELRRLVEKAPQRPRGVTDATRDPTCR